MKSSLILVLLVITFVTGCTRKYTDYDVIHKLQFRDNPEARPIAPAMAKSHRDDVAECFGQWLFFNNAEKEKDRYLPALVQVLCPGSEYLLDTTITHQWWTTIVYSRSCVEVKAHCPVKQPKK